MFTRKFNTKILFLFLFSHHAHSITWPEFLKLIHDQGRPHLYFGVVVPEKSLERPNFIVSLIATDTNFDNPPISTHRHSSHYYITGHVEGNFVPLSMLQLENAVSLPAETEETEVDFADCDGLGSYDHRLEDNPLSHSKYGVDSSWVVNFLHGEVNTSLSYNWFVHSSDGEYGQMRIEEYMGETDPEVSYALALNSDSDCSARQRCSYSLNTSGILEGNLGDIYELFHFPAEHQQSSFLNPASYYFDMNADKAGAIYRRNQVPNLSVLVVGGHHLIFWDMGFYTIALVPFALAVHLKWLPAGIASKPKDKDDKDEPFGDGGASAGAGSESVAVNLIYDSNSPEFPLPDKSEHSWEQIKESIYSIEARFHQKPDLEDVASEGVRPFILMWILLQSLVESQKSLQ